MENFEIGLIVRVTDALIFCWLFFGLYITFKPQRSVKSCVLEAAGFGVAGFVLILVFERITVMRFSMYPYTLTFLLIGALFAIVSTKGSMPNKLIYVFIFVAALFQVQFITTEIGIRMPISFYDKNRLSGQVSSIFMTWFLWRNTIRTNRKIPIAYWLSVVSTALVGLLLCIFVMTYMFDADTVLPSIILLLCAILALALEMIVFWLSRKLIQNYENTIVNVAQRSQQDGDSQLAQAVTRMNEELREMRHEIRNHLSLINTLLAQGEIEQAKAIVASLADEESSLLTPISTISSGNRVADAILSQKIAQAKVLGIPMKVEAYLTENLPIASIDLCSLLSNLINNALEASAKINEPSISVVIKPLKNYISIKVTNAIDRSVLTFNPELATTKRNPESHGIGLEIVKKVAAKYDGITHFEAQDRQFNSEVLLQLNAEGTLTRSLDSRSLAPLEPRARID